MHRLYSFVAATVVAGLLGAAPVTAQTIDDVFRYSERAPATGAHDMGWLDANGTSGNGTYTALFGNPAGLGWATSSTIAGGLTGDFTTNEARMLVPGEQNNAPFDRTQSGYRIGNAALVYRVPTEQGNLVLGGAINRTRSFDRTLVASGINGQSSITDTFLPGSPSPAPNDDGSFTFDRRLTTLAFDAGAIEFDPSRADTDNNDFIQAVRPGGDRNVEQREDLIESGGLYDANFGGAVEVAPNVMLGGAFTVAFGSYSFDRIYEEVDVNDTHTGSQYDVILGDGAVLSGFDALTFEQGIEADLTGFGARFGASARPIDELRLGVSFATPTYYTVTETFGTRIETFFDEGGSLAAGALDDNEFEYEVRTPWRVSAGGELDLGPLAIAGDVAVIDWSTLDFSADGGGLGVERDIDRQIRDLDVTVNSRIGAAFSADALTIRTGLAFQPNPDEESARSDRTFLSGGISYAFDSNLMLDIGWMQERFTDEFVAYGRTEVPDARGTADPLLIDEDVVRNTISLGLRYRF
ncbi:MAG: outer membrane protein transport protein [Longimonas sp.]|uniref:OmpP1/FadL family transporter n=1 Tax=Longimonas sp. TaxID=2039626 RepID=UPI003974DA02